MVFGFGCLDFGVGIVGLRLRWLVWRLVWCLGCDVEVVGLCVSALYCSPIVFFQKRFQ